MRRRGAAHRPGMWLDWAMVAIAFLLAVIVGITRPDRGGTVAGRSDAPAVSSAR